MWPPLTVKQLQPAAIRPGRRPFPVELSSRILRQSPSTNTYTVTVQYRQMMQRHKSTRKQLNVNTSSVQFALKRRRKNTHRFCPSPHTCTHTLAFKWGGDCWSYAISKLALCITEPELIHILNLSRCFIVRHLFFYSHQGDKRQQSHASSCSPLLLRLCAGSCFADQWMGSDAGHKAPQIKGRENREEWGLPPSGDLP